MKPNPPLSAPVQILSRLAGLIILLIPFHAFITVWLASVLGHYTLLRLWKEFVLAILVVGASIILARDKNLRRLFWRLNLVKLIIAYFVILAVCAIGGWGASTVSLKAMFYGLLVDTRFLVFFLVILVLAAKSDWLPRRWPKLVFWPAALVAAFAVLQYLVLPFDFLKHFGYGPNTIRPYEAISRTTKHLRVASTLRGANNLGAYLLVPIAVLAGDLLRKKTGRIYGVIFGLGLAAALIFSFSRSAWIGAAIATAIVCWFALKSQKARRIGAGIIVALAIMAAAVFAALKNNANFQDIFLHTDHTSTIVTSSNGGHLADSKAALKDISHQPWGGGVGSAGPQSVYNNYHPPRIAEDYYLQIGQEAGLLGMGLFIAVNVYLGINLYRLRAQPLALALLAALIGLSFVNLLSHAWEDDTLAYVFWGLAGIAASPAIMGVKRKQNGQIQKP